MRLAKKWPDGPLVFGRDELIAEFVRCRISFAERGFGPCSAIGIIRHKKLIGGIVFYDYQPWFKSVTVAYAFDSPIWASREVLGSCGAYAFIQLGCERLNTVTPRKLKRSRRFVEHIGFKLEGCVRKGFGNDDAMIYGMLKSECPWIKDENGKEITARAAAAA